MKFGSYLFAAVHMGPYLSIQPLEDELGADGVTYLVDGVALGERLRLGLPCLSLEDVTARWGSLGGFLQTEGIKAVVRSCSEDVTEPNVEVMAAIEVRSAGIPVFVVEDFPGNYSPEPGERLDALFVEDPSLESIHTGRGVSPGVIHPTGNPRYAALAQADHRNPSEVRQGLRLGDGPVILWVGQPDGEYSFLALERLLRDFRDPKVSLLFRAHPRDSAYLAGRYNELLATSSLNVKDVSSYPDMIDLYHAADLVVTQFSSAAVEASYLGVPALYVLFDDLGRLNLEALKGYSSLPWWENESAFLVQREGQIAQVLTTALFDHEARARIRANFQSRFASRPSPVHAIADRVRELAAAPI